MKASERFAEEILVRGWSNSVAGRELDCAPSYVAGLKGGRVTPSLSLAARIEEVLGIPCKLWAAEKSADRERNRPAALGRQGRKSKATTPAPRSRGASRT